MVDCCCGGELVAGWLRPHHDRVIRQLPVVFYSSDEEDVVRQWAKALVPDAIVTNTLEGLIRKLVSVLVNARLNPIGTPTSKVPTSVA